MHLPAGIITIWFGAIVDIPLGWALCDGNNGTPDLRNKFIPGAGDVYDPGDVGGANTHLHTFISDGHFHTWLLLGPLGPGATFDTVSDTKAVPGITDAESSLPPFYALAYIMSL